MKRIIKYLTFSLFIICAFVLFKNTRFMTTSLGNSDNKLFNVVLSSDKDSIKEENIIPQTKPQTITATSAKINTTIISDINVTFTKPGQTAVYKVYAHNNGTTKAYLKGIIAGRLICTPGENTPIETSNQYCSNVSLTIETNKEKSFSTTNIDGSLINIKNHQLPSNSVEEIKIIITSTNIDKDFGQFNIMVPTISLIYYSND